MRSPMFRRLLASSFLLIAATVVGLDLYLSRYVARYHVKQVEQRLAAQARILAGEAAAAPLPQLESWAREAGRRASARVTLIDAGGRVLADSHHGPESMENHAGRPEVRAALEGRQGSAVRHSATLERDLSYVAVPMQYGGQPAVIRLALPLAEVDTAVAAVRRPILLASLVAAIGALATAYIISHSFVGRIRRLQVFAGRVLDSPAAAPLPAGPDDEVGALARTMSSMAAQIRELVGRLQLEAERRRAILVGMVEGVLAVDGKLNVLFCNQAFARAVDAAYPVPEGLPLVELVRDPQLLETLGKVLASGQSRKQRIELQAATKRSYEIQASPLTVDTGRGAIALLHDITDLERLERVRKDFVANVSHEIRTPLTAIHGYAETLLEGALEDRANARRFVEIIRSHAVRLNRIASDLLVLSELDAGREQAPPAPLSIRAALDSALLAVESEARVRGVRLVRGPIADFQVTGRRLRLEQALINLLDNAVKFNRPGGQVVVEAGRLNGRGRIVIADTGIGIPSEDLPRIFERFYRVDKARSREVGGTGLGLSIVKHVVENMGGSVSAASQLGKGSTFTLVLPCLVPSPERNEGVIQA